jgi:acetyl-CoA carboxylase carboxyltransferase component
MNSRELWADLVLAWPQAQLGVMGASQAVGLVHRRVIAAAEDPVAAREHLAGEYERDYLTAEAAAREGVVDEIVTPAATRQRLAAALRVLAGSDRSSARNRNIPL